MALKEQAQSHIKGIVGKVFGGLVGLVVTGGLMWFTPLIDRFVKPAKPLANFASEETTDLTVTFKNLSQNAKQAKWDFGDGSPLEVVAGDVPVVKHKFKKANSYKVKLVVSNVANQEDSRESLIAVGVKPQVLDLSSKALNQKAKPYTAGVQIKFEATADLDAQFEWDFGNGVYQTGSETMVHEFALPGKYLVKVRATMGHQKGSPSLQEIEVLPQSGIVTTGATSPSSFGTPRGKSSGPHINTTLAVDVTIRSMLSADTLKKSRLHSVTLKGKSNSSTVQEVIRATPGYVIKSARFEPSTLKKSSNIINESVSTSDEGKTVVVKAQMTKPGADYQFNVAVLYEEELAPSAVRESQATMTLPGSSSSMELPIGTKHELEIRYKGQTIVKLPELPIKAFDFSVAGKTFAVTTIKNAGRVAITCRELPRRLQQ